MWDEEFTIFGAFCGVGACFAWYHPTRGVGVGFLVFAVMANFDSLWGTFVNWIER